MQPQRRSMLSGMLAQLGSPTRSGKPAQPEKLTPSAMPTQSPPSHPQFRTFSPTRAGWGGRGFAGMVVAGLGSLALAQPAIAHGANITTQTTEAIEIQATYDSGEPMGQAEVVIYAPNDPGTPWQTGMTNGAGRFSFVPDASQPGNWEVKVRQAGHGDLVTIPIDNQGTVTAVTTGTAPLPRWVAIASVVWGCVGTALFFTGRTSAQDQASTGLPATGQTSTGGAVSSSAAIATTSTLDSSPSTPKPHSPDHSESMSG